MARTPVASGSSMRGRVQGCGGRRQNEVRSAQRRLRACRRSRGLRRRSPGPTSPSPTRSQRAVRHSRTRLPCRTPLRSLSGYSNVSSSRKPTTSANSGAPALRVGFQPPLPPGPENRPPPPSCPTVCATLPTKAVGMMFSSWSMRSSMALSRRMAICRGTRTGYWSNSSSIRFNWDSNCWSMAPKRVSTRQPPGVISASAFTSTSPRAEISFTSFSHLAAEHFVVGGIQTDAHL